MSHGWRGTAFPYVTWLMWHYHGDTAVIARTLPQLTGYMAFHAIQYDKTADSGFKGYWESCIAGWTVVGPVSRCSLMTAFAYVNELRLMAEMTAAVGEAELSSAYRANHSARLLTFHASFYNKTTATYGHDTLDDLAMSRWLGAPPTPELAAAVAAQLAGKVEEQLGIVNPNSSAVAEGTATSTSLGPVSFPFSFFLFPLFLSPLLSPVTRFRPSPPPAPWGLLFVVSMPVGCGLLLKIRCHATHRIHAWYYPCMLGTTMPESRSATSAGTAMSGGVGVRYLYEALARSGHADVALQLAMRKTYPSFGYMVG